MKRLSHRLISSCLFIAAGYFSPTAFAATLHAAKPISFPENGNLRMTVCADTLQQADTTGLKKRKFKVGVYEMQDSISFNPMDYTMQKRYIYRGYDFDRLTTLDRLSWTLYSGAETIVPVATRGLSWGMPFGVQVGYQLSRLHGFRLDASYVRYRYRDITAYVDQFGLSADYLFHITNFINGYNPQAFFNMAGVLGLGYLHSAFYDQQEDMIKGHLGLNMTFRLGHNTAFYLEPNLAVLPSRADYSEPNNPKGYNFLFGVKAGLTFRSAVPDPYTEVAYLRAPFFEVGQGMMLPFRSPMTGMMGLGTHTQISVGKWFTPVLGLRLGLGGSEYYFDREISEPTKEQPAGYETRYRGALVMGRLDGLINPLNLFPRLRYQPRVFDLNITLGGDFGYIYMQNNELRCPYFGYGAGLQAFYHLDKHTSLFIEPRFLVANYRVPYVNVNRELLYSEYFGSLQLGVRLSRPASVKTDRPVRRNTETERSYPRWFAGMQFGGLKVPELSKIQGDAQPQWFGNAQFGAHLHPLISARVQLGYKTLTNHAMSGYEVIWMDKPYHFESVWNRKFHMLDMKASYLLNLTNLYCGDYSGRRFDLYLTAGATFSYVLAQNNSLYSKELQVGENPPQPDFEDISSKIFPAVHYGFMGTYRILPQIEVFVETELQQYFKRNTFLNEGINGRNLMMQMSAGVNYTF